MKPQPDMVSLEEVAGFSDAIEGSVLDRRSEGYEAARRALVWQERVPARYPQIIVAARSGADVQATVAFARRHRLPLSVRGSGHSYAVVFLRDGGIVIDMSALDAITVDPAAMRVSVGAGATSRQIDAALSAHGLAFPVGHGGPVGIAGFLLGGGLGINCGAWGGMSTFNILGADVVLADGSACTVNAGEAPDLYWALRGGGPGLPGIVTRFHLRCYPRPAAILANSYIDRVSALPRLAAMIDALSPRLDPRLQVMVTLMSAPPELIAQCAPEDHGRVAALTAIAFADDAASAHAMLAPIATHPDLAAVLHRGENDPLTFPDFFAQTDQLLACKRVRADNIQTDRLSDAAAILLRHLPASPSPASVSLIVRRGPLPADTDAAFALPGAYSVSTYAQWDDARNDAANARWLKSCHDELSEVATGAYVNEFDIEARQPQLPLCYAASTLERLRLVRKKYDPLGLFDLL